MLDLGEGGGRQAVGDRVPVSVGARPAIDAVYRVDTPHARASSIDRVVAVDARAAPVVQPLLRRRPPRRRRQQHAVRRRLARRGAGGGGVAGTAGAGGVETATLRAVSAQLGLLGGAVTPHGEPQLFHHVRPDGALQRTIAKRAHARQLLMQRGRPAHLPTSGRQPVGG